MEPLPLKDIHLPEAIGAWPPAPGWWLLALILATLAAAGYYLYRHLKRQSAVKSALKWLKNLRQQPNPEPLSTLTALSALLRRTAISIAPRSEVASLHGDAWLNYLDRSLPDAPFSNGVGRCLADGHYRPSLADEIDLAALFAVCERWLKQQRKKS